MAKFQRLFQFIQDRMIGQFPNAQGEQLYPREVHDDVQLVHELLKADTKHLIKMLSFADNQAIPIGSVSCFGPEPNVGRVIIPVTTSVQQDSGGNLKCTFLNDATGNLEHPNPITQWDDATFITDMLISSTWSRQGPNLPWLRGQRLQATITGIAAVGTFRLRMLAFDIPHELFDFGRCYASPPFSPQTL